MCLTVWARPVRGWPRPRTIISGSEGGHAREPSSQGGQSPQAPHPVARRPRWPSRDGPRPWPVLQPPQKASANSDIRCVARAPHPVVRRPRPPTRPRVCVPGLSCLRGPSSPPRRFQHARAPHRPRVAREPLPAHHPQGLAVHVYTPLSAQPPTAPHRPLVCAPKRQAAHSALPSVSICPRAPSRPRATPSASQPVRTATAHGPSAAAPLGPTGGAARPCTRAHGGGAAAVGAGP